MKNHKCKTEGCETTMSDGTPELCPSCQDDMETRYAALLLHTQTVVDENARLREVLQMILTDAETPNGLFWPDVVSAVRNVLSNSKLSNGRLANE